MYGKMTSSQFFEALKNNKLMGIKCTQCGEITCPPRTVCQECGSPEGELTELSRKGVIRTYTVSNVAAPCFKTPYVVAMVETEEGPWLMGNILTLPPERITEDLVGRKVQIGSIEVEGDTFSKPGVALVFVPTD